MIKFDRSKYNFDLVISQFGLIKKSKNVLFIYTLYIIYCVLRYEIY